MPDQLSTAGPNVVIADKGLMYWRARDGRVFAADATDSEYAKRTKRGFEPLDRYGQFSSGAYYMDHPYEPLFQAGGAREMSAGELLALGYAQKPPLVPTCGQHVGQGKEHLNHTANCWVGARPAHFPQLEGMDIPPLRSCEHCDRDDLTEAAWVQHQAVMQTEDRREEALSRAILKGLQSAGGTGGSSAAEIAATVVATLQALQNAAREEPEPEPPPPEDDDGEEPEPEPEPEPSTASRRVRNTAGRFV